MKWNEARRPRACLAHTSSGRLRVTVRANYVALPFAAGRGEDEGGESRPDQGSSCSPILTRKYGPDAIRRRSGCSPQLLLRRGFARCGSRPLSRRPHAASMERRKAMRSLVLPPSHAANDRATTTMLRLAALHPPRFVRARTRQASRALFEGQPKSSPRAFCAGTHLHARCLKIESERKRTRRERVRQNAYRCVGVAARNRQNQLRPSSLLRPVVTRHELFR